MDSMNNGDGIQINPHTLIRIQQQRLAEKEQLIVQLEAALEQTLAQVRELEHDRAGEEAEVQ